MRPLTTLLIAAALLVAPRPLLAAEEEPVTSSVEGAEERQAHVVIRSSDLLRGSGLAVTEKAVLIKTAYSGKVEIDRRAAAGIAFGPGHDDKILEASGERDVLYLSTGDKVSGEIVGTDGGKLVIKTFYAGGKESRIALEKIDYITFRQPGPTDALELKPDPVRVIFDNGDVVGGTLAGFKNGAFRLETQYAGTLHFDLDRIQSLHNAANSRQFFPGGLADAFMQLFMRSGQLRREHRNILPWLIRGFLSQGDTDGALHVLRRMARYEVDPWTYQQLAEAFEAAKQPEAALLCYERMFTQRGHNVHVFKQLYQAYTRHGRHVRAAEVYEELLKQPPSRLASYGFTEPQVHMSLAETYDKLEEYEKAIGHLRKVLGDPAAEPSTRRKARAALVSGLKKIGRLEELITKYVAEAAALDAQLGKDYLALVAEYVERDKLAKARIQLERLQHLGLDEYAAKAQRLIKEAEGDRPEDDDTRDDNED